MIKFSVITVTYQAAKVFERTAESVLLQSYPYVEHLLIDGASMDDTLRLAQAYKTKSDQQGNGHEVHIFSEPDKGLYDAMNKGLTKATGNYVLFLNAGDFLPNAHTLEDVAHSVGEGEPLPAVLYGDTDVVDAHYQFVRHRRLSPPEKLTWRSFRHGMLVCHQAFYARTDLARQFPYDTHYRHSADVDWCIRVMKEAERQELELRNLYQVVANFLEGGDSIQHHRASLCERFDVMCRHYGLLSTLIMHAWFVIRAVVRR